MLRSTLHAFLALGLAAAFAPPARSEYVSQTIALDQSNKFPDGIAYGSVTIEAYDGLGAAGGGLSAGQVRITYSADLLPSYGKVLFFGMNAVAFNTDLELKKSQIKGPDFWHLHDDEKLDGFGRFTWTEHSFLGIPRQTPVTILVSKLGSDATLDHFLIGSTLQGGGEPPQGSSAFAAHVTGIGIGCTFEPHWIGNSMPIFDNPEPATLTLAAMALLGLGIARLGRHVGRAG